MYRRLAVNCRHREGWLWALCLIPPRAGITGMRHHNISGFTGDGTLCVLGKHSLNWATSAPPLNGFLNVFQLPYARSNGIKMAVRTAYSREEKCWQSDHLHDPRVAQRASNRPLCMVVSPVRLHPYKAGEKQRVIKAWWFGDDRKIRQLARRAVDSRENQTHVHNRALLLCWEINTVHEVNLW